MSDGLRTWTIYDHPRDHPDHFVVRGWTATAHHDPIPDPHVRLARSLDEARDLLPHGLYRLERQTNDDPCIVETWL